MKVGDVMQYVANEYWLNSIIIIVRYIHFNSNTDEKTNKLYEQLQRLNKRKASYGIGIKSLDYEMVYDRQGDPSGLRAECKIEATTFDNFDKAIKLLFSFDGIVQDAATAKYGRGLTMIDVNDMDDDILEFDLDANEAYCYFALRY